MRVRWIEVFRFWWKMKRSYKVEYVGFWNPPLGTPISAMGCVYLSISWLEMGAGLKKDLRVSRVGPGGSLNAFFFLLIGVISQRLAMVRKKGGTGTLGERSTTESCMLRSGRMNRSRKGIYWFSPNWLDRRCDDFWFQLLTDFGIWVFTVNIQKITGAYKAEGCFALNLSYCRFLGWCYKGCVLNNLLVDFAVKIHQVCNHAH